MGERKLLQALTALECDGVLTAEQLRRHHQCLLKQIKRAGGKVATVPVTATRYATCVHTVRFVTLETRLLSLPGTELRHLAGLAELRALLDAPTTAWTRHEGLAHSKGRPDALWHEGEQTKAIEFDAGGYSQTKLLKKMLAFRAWSDEQVWGSASQAHAERIQSVAEKSFTPVRVLVVAWLRSKQLATV
jgi:hypothetical protein